MGFSSDLNPFDSFMLMAGTGFAYAALTGLSTKSLLSSAMAFAWGFVWVAVPIVVAKLTFIWYVDRELRKIAAVFEQSEVDDKMAQALSRLEWIVEQILAKDRPGYPSFRFIDVLFAAYNLAFVENGSKVAQLSQERTRISKIYRDILMRYSMVHPDMIILLAKAIQYRDENSQMLKENLEAIPQILMDHKLDNFEVISF